MGVLDGNNWCRAMAICVDALPTIQKKLREIDDRSDKIAKAHAAMERGEIGDCVAVLGDLVEKSEFKFDINKSDVKLDLGQAPKLPSAEPDRARLIEKRNQLLELRDSIRSMRGKSIGKAAPVPISTGTPAVIWQRLSKSEIERKSALAHRLELIRGQLDSRRNWAPLKLRKAALAMRLNSLREGVHS
jgi:hypothetical protein